MSSLNWLGQTAGHAPSRGCVRLDWACSGGITVKGGDRTSILHDYASLEAVVARVS